MVVKVTREIARARLGDVNGDLRFYCADGRYFRNLKELAEALAQMSEDLYQRHVSAGHNDFSNWIRDVFLDDILAKDIAKSTSSTQAARLITDRISWLTKKANTA